MRWGPSIPFRRSAAWPDRPAPLVCRCRPLCTAWADQRAGTRLRFPGLLAVQVFWAASGRDVWTAGTAAIPGGVSSATCSAASPGKWMTGTQSHESICGAAAAVDYIAALAGSSGNSRADQLDDAFRRIQDWERLVGDRLLSGLRELKTFRLWGLRDSGRWNERAPTFSVTHRTRLRNSSRNDCWPMDSLPGPAITMPSPSARPWG